MADRLSAASLLRGLLLLSLAALIWGALGARDEYAHKLYHPSLEHLSAIWSVNHHRILPQVLHLSIASLRGFSMLVAMELKVLAASMLL